MKEISEKSQAEFRREITRHMLGAVLVVIKGDFPEETSGGFPGAKVKLNPKLRLRSNVLIR